jgi:hypothetical protein
MPVHRNWLILLDAPTSSQFIDNALQIARMLSTRQGSSVLLLFILWCGPEPPAGQGAAGAAAVAAQSRPKRRFLTQQGWIIQIRCPQRLQHQ